jgi:hypothetical protein
MVCRASQFSKLETRLHERGRLSPRFFLPARHLVLGDALLVLGDALRKSLTKFVNYVGCICHKAVEPAGFVEWT